MEKSFGSPTSVGFAGLLKQGLKTIPGLTKDVKQKLFIFIFLILMAAVLIGLNAASYTQKEKTPDTEISPNRSTFNAGATGTQAFYSLLSETGRKVTRWRQPPAALLTSKADGPSVFVVIGTVRRQFTAAETQDLLRWVGDGGRLVLIDREPPEALVTTTASWRITVGDQNTPAFFPADPTDQTQMTVETAAVKGVQPTVFTQGVNAIQPSRFSSSISFTRFADDDVAGDPQGDETIRRRSKSYDSVEAPSMNAPVVHFAAGEMNLIVDAPFGGGQIVFLSDPYIVSNGGISLVDNAQLAVNLVAAGDGMVAFDEYHQGYGADNNRFLQFFEGTPVVAIFLQAMLLVGLVFLSQSRRFARPVPESEPDRLQKLEYIAAMAELQSRTKAFDLAIENIYNDFRRRATRYFGLDNFTAKSGEIAALIAERTGLDRAQIADTLFKCEEIIRGEPTNKREVLHLADALRVIEQKLGMTRSTRTRI